MQLPSRPLGGAIALMAALIFASGVTGCALEPDVGPLQAERCDNVDSDPDEVVSYSDNILPMMTRASGGCISCHDPSQPNPVGFSIGGLNLTTYENLRNGGSRTANDIIVDGEPCSSAIYLKLTSAPFGSQMPADGPPFWTPSELQLLKDWIAEGAPNN